MMASNPKILPRVLLPKSNPDSPSSPSLDSTRERGEPPSKRQRKCISNACMPCRKRKSKCDGERPNCSACITVYNTDCNYDLDADHRRKGALKRDIAELTESNRKIGLVIDAIRKRSEADVDDIIQLIRTESDLSHDEIADKIESLSSVKHPEIIEDQPTSLENELVVDIRKGSFDKSGEGRHYGMTSNLGLHAEDQRTVAVDQIGAWTNITNDTEFINHLLSLYFTWAHPWYMFFPEEVFYHGMEQRKSRYCTPLLMNAILAFGCHFSDRPEARADPNNPKTAGEHFFQEARRLLIQEEDNSSLTLVQALALMSLRQVMNGNDSAGRRYAAQMMSKAIELGLHTSVAAQPSGKLTLTEIEARRVTFWGCFILEVNWAVCAGRISFLPRHAICLEKPILSADLEQKLWPPQGSLDGNITSTPTGLQQPGHRYGILLQASLLSEIIDDIVHMFYAPRDRITSRRLQLHHENLLTWYNNLPEELAMRKSGPTLPQVITLHLCYYNCALILFRPYLNWAFVQQMSKSPRQICTESANAISELTDMYANIYGAKRLFVINTHSLMSAAIIHLANLNRPNPSPDQEKHLASAFRKLNAMAGTYNICHRFASILRNKVYTWCKNGIPPSVQQALDDLEIETPSSAMVSPTTIPGPRQPITTPTNRTNSVGSTNSNTSNNYPPYRRNSFSRKPSAPEIIQMAPPSLMTQNPFSAQKQMQNGFFNPLGGFEGVPLPVQTNAGNAGPMGISGILDGDFPDWNKDGFILEQQGAVDFSWGFGGVGFGGAV